MANRKKNRGKNSGNGSADKDNLSPAEKHKNWTTSKVERAGQDDYNVIQQKTKDTSATVNFLNIIDGLMYYIRMNEGVPGSKVKEGTLAKYTGRLAEQKNSLNQLAAEICKDTGREYRPPRGYKNPLLSDKPQQKAKKAAKPAAKAAEKSAGDAPAKVTAGSPAAAGGSSAALVIPPKAADAHSAPAMAAASA